MTPRSSGADPSADYRRGLLLAKAGNLEGAATALETVTGPLQTWAMARRAGVLVALGRVTEAEAAVTALVSREDSDPIRGAALVTRARARSALGRPAEAAMDLEAAVSETHLLRAVPEVRALQAEFWTKAGERAAVHRALLDAVDRRGTTTALRRTLEKELTGEFEAGRTVDSFTGERALRWARYLGGAGEVEAALDALAKAPPVGSPGGFEAELLKARYESRLGRRDRAIARLEVLLAGADVPADGRLEATLFLGQVQRSAKLDDSAGRTFDTVIALAPSSSPAAEARLERARLLEDAGRKTDAEALRRHVLERQAATWVAAPLLFERGMDAYEAGRFGEAADYLGRFVKHHSRRRMAPTARYWQALAALKTGDRGPMSRIAEDPRPDLYRTFADDRLRGVAPRFSRPPKRWPPTSLARPAELMHGAEPSATTTDAGLAASLARAEAWDDLAYLFEHRRRRSPRSFPIRHDLSVAYQRMGRPRDGLQIAEEIDLAADELEGLDPTRLTRILFPVPHAARFSSCCEKYGVPPWLALAIAREESHFQEDVRSRSDARGLMQIIPPTGKWLAPKIGIPSLDPARLYEPELNIELGVYYLGYLLRLYKSYRNPELLTMAAYNGGPGNLERWLKKFGSLPIDEFIEKIPLEETRFYVKKVGRSRLGYEGLD